MERRDQAETRHKLAPIAKGPYQVKSTDDRSKTVVIEYDDRTVENVSRSRVVLAPKGETPKETQDAVRPALISETISDYPVPESTNNQHLVEEIIQAPPEGTSSPATEFPEKQPEKANIPDDLSVSDVTTDEVQAEPDEFFIDSIVDHKTNRSKRHPNAKYGDVLYKVRWNGYRPEDDTWEPLPNLTRSHVIAYHQQKQLELLTNLSETINDIVGKEPKHSEEEPAQGASIIDNLVDHDHDMIEDTWSYRVRWYGRESKHDTWKPLSSLPRNKVISYHHRNSLHFPTNLDLAIDG